MEKKSPQKLSKIVTCIRAVKRDAKNARGLSQIAHFLFSLCLFFFLRRSYYLQAWQRLEKNILRVCGKAQSVFFLHAIARHFFFLGFEIMEEFFWIWPFKTTTKNFYDRSSTRYNSFLTFYNRTFQTIINVLF